MMTIASRRSRVMIAMAAALIFAGSAAEARVGGRSSMGSRGSRTWSAPPSTNTAPGAAAPIQRSQVPNQGPAMNAPGAGAAATAAAPRRFGFGTGLMAGLFGAGLLGMLMGNGFLGGLGGLASIFGLLLQIGLVVLLVSFAMKWFRRRQEPAFAGPAHARSMTGGSVPPTGPSGAGLGGNVAGGGLGGMLGGALGGLKPAATARPGVRDEIGIGEGDFAAFEKSLVDVQAAYSRGDVARIWQLATPEMAGYIQEELNDFASRGEVNRVSDVKLLQGDLAEAWREGEAEFATVAMRYALKDVTTDKATGRIVEGDPTQLTEANEIWTFRRARGGNWVLSAIQQVN
ncbi:Tim44 domain-containing protein [Microvirga antarctica]|uniref:Tim44 domain-containing protein n=1 Tax=Microvirga antarctica TaxID=2819233 RepID=UPI001B30E8BA|nr:Tim44 domain-containing protein [Microvirga antarctica]